LLLVHMGHFEQNACIPGRCQLCYLAFYLCSMECSMTQGWYLVAWNDMVTRLHTGHTLSNTLNNSCCFVAKDARKKALRICEHK